MSDDRGRIDRQAVEELIGLWADGTLPETLRVAVEALLSSDPALAAEAWSLRAVAEVLSHAATPSRPDDWFVERSLSRLLREHNSALEFTKR